LTYHLLKININEPLESSSKWCSIIVLYIIEHHLDEDSSGSLIFIFDISSVEA